MHEVLVCAGRLRETLALLGRNGVGKTTAADHHGP